MEQVITLENEREILENIANEYDISLVETTIGMNGYPKQLRYALTDFKSFEQYCEIKDKYHLDELNLHRKDGWQLWERNNTWGNQPYTAEDYVEKISGDNYILRCWGKNQKNDFIKFQIEEELKNDKFEYLIPTEYFLDIKEWNEIPTLLNSLKSQLDFHTMELVECEEDFAYSYKTLNKIQQWWENNNKIIAKFDEIEDNESIVEYAETCYQNFDYDVIPNEMCGYYNDTNYYQFGLYICEINEEVIALNYYIEYLCNSNRNKKFSKPFAIDRTQVVGIDDWGYFVTINDDSITIDDMDYTSLYDKLELKNFLEIEFNIEENERKSFFSEE